MLVMTSDTSYTYHLEEKTTDTVTIDEIDSNDRFTCMTWSMDGAFLCVGLESGRVINFTTDPINSNSVREIQLPPSVKYSKLKQSIYNNLKTLQLSDITINH